MIIKLRPILIVVSVLFGGDAKAEQHEAYHSKLRRGMADLFKPRTFVERNLEQCPTQLPFNPQECDGNRCTSNDLQVVAASIELPSCFTCTPCSTVTGTLKLAIDNGTGSTRTTFGYGANVIEQKDPSCGATETCASSRCADGGALAPNTITEQGFGDFTFTCGSRLFLDNIFQFWSPANAGSDCPSYTSCKDMYPKCGVLQTIEIAPNLSIQEAAGCRDQSANIDIDVTVFGGIGPYTYSWTKSGDSGFSASTEDLINVPDGVYTLTVTDSSPDSCELSKTFGPFNCCYFEAACAIDPMATYQCFDEVPGTLPLDDVFDYNAAVQCNEPVFAAAEGVTGVVCPNQQTITRTYTLVDGSESLTCVQTITVSDTTDPTFDGPLPQGETVECNAVPMAPVLTASDNCGGNVQVALVETSVAGNCPDNYTLTRTWTATDDCGNSATHTQIVTVRDTTDPLLSACPSDITINICNDLIPAVAAVTASDNCDNTVAVDFDCCFDGNGMTRTWTATDRCGNQAECLQSITFTQDCLV